MPGPFRIWLFLEQWLRHLQPETLLHTIDKGLPRLERLLTDSNWCTHKRAIVSI